MTAVSNTTVVFHPLSSMYDSFHPFLRHISSHNIVQYCFIILLSSYIILVILCFSSSNPAVLYYCFFIPAFIILFILSLLCLILRGTVSSSSVYCMNLSTHPPYLCHSPLLNVSSCSSCFLQCSYRKNFCSFTFIHYSLLPALRHPSYLHSSYIFFFSIAILFGLYPT
jgi:hypothetical protein